MALTRIVGNWKMNLGMESSRTLARELVAECQELKFTSVWLAPTHLAIPDVVKITQGSKVKIGAQNVHWSDKGPFTGEISPTMLKEFGCSFSIVGHSERRIEFGETATLCAKRALGALEHGLEVIFCVGETNIEREAGRTHEVLFEQLEPLLSAIPKEQIPQITLAYEPVWAIGSGLSANSSEIEETHREINKIAIELMGGQIAPILYGGSVTPDNFQAIIESSLVAGALVGSASLQIESLRGLIKLSEAAN